MPSGRFLITLHQLEIFVAIARSGSFTRASEALYLSPASVSQQVKLMEHAIGARLLDRAPRQAVRLTEAGTVLLETSEALFDGLEKALHTVRYLQRTREEVLEVGWRPSSCSFLLLPVLTSFQERHPGVAVHVNAGSRVDLIEGLRRSRMDLIVVVDPVEDPQLESTRLTAADIVLVGPPGHRFTGETTARFDALVGERFIYSDGGYGATRRRFERKAAELGLSLPSPWEAGPEEAQLAAIASGLGVGLAACWTARPHIAAGELAVLEVEGFPIRLDLYIVHRREDDSQLAQQLRMHMLSQQRQIEAHSLYPAPMTAI